MPSWNAEAVLSSDEILLADDDGLLLLADDDGDTLLTDDSGLTYDWTPEAAI